MEGPDAFQSLVGWGFRRGTVQAESVLTAADVAVSSSHVHLLKSYRVRDATRRRRGESAGRRGLCIRAGWWGREAHVGRSWRGKETAFSLALPWGGGVEGGGCGLGMQPALSRAFGSCWERHEDLHAFILVGPLVGLRPVAKRKLQLIISFQKSQNEMAKMHAGAVQSN